MKLRYLKLNNQGTILIEMLISLLIVSIVMHSMLISITSYQRIYQYFKHDYTADWQQFLVLIEAEINMYQLQKVEKNIIYLKNGQNTAQIILSNQKIYKTPGHQPYSYEVQEWQVIQKGDFIEIVLTYQNDQTFMGLIHYE